MAEKYEIAIIYYKEIYDKIKKTFFRYCSPLTVPLAEKHGLRVISLYWPTILTVILNEIAMV